MSGFTDSIVNSVGCAIFRLIRVTLAMVFTLMISLLWFEVQAELISKDEILAISPRAKPELIEAVLANQAALEHANIDTRLRQAHFFAQVLTETGGLRRIDENLNYSERRLLEVFTRRLVPTAKAKEIAGEPRLIANWIYGDRLGNRGRNTNDGWNFRGSGYLQLTGRENFRRISRLVGIDLEKDPALSRHPRVGLLTAVSYWQNRNINRAADFNESRRVRVLVNGPRAHGYLQSQLWLKRAWTLVFFDRAAAPNEIVVSMENGEVLDNADPLVALLEDGGFLPTDTMESGVQSEKLEDAIRAYQRSRGLMESGTLDDDTLYSITDPEEWRSTALEEVGNLNMRDLEIGVVRDLRETNDHQAIELPHNKGTGEQISRSKLTTAESGELAASDATYADYELNGGRRNAQDAFVPFTIIGSDDRKVVLNTSSFPARAVVQITYRRSPRGARKSCSGSMVSPDTVLTAGHCVHSGTSSGRWFSEFQVFPGRNTNRKPFGSCQALRSFALLGWVTAVNSREAREFDLGALKLDCTAGEKTGWLGITTVPDDSLGLETVVQGYANDKTPRGRQWVSRDKLTALHELKAFYRNDTFGGTSGAPVLLEKSNNLFCVHTNGLHGRTSPWNKNNACTRITATRMAEIQRWINN